MSIRRRKKEQQFTQLNNAAIRRPSMSLKAKGLLAVMMSCPEDWQFYMSWLEQQSKDGKEAHQSAMKELEEHGYVVRQRVNDEKGRLTWEYVVDDEPMEKPATTMGGKPGHGGISTMEGFSTHGLTVDGSTAHGSAVHGKPATTNTEYTKTDLTKTDPTNNEAAPSGGGTSRTSGPGAAAAPSPDGSEQQAIPTELEAGEDLPPPSQTGQSQDENPAFHTTSTENVPGGAAGGYAILSLTPVPRGALQARPARDPEHMPQLRALLSSSHRSRLPHLRALLEGATQTGGVPRELLTRLTDPELSQVAQAAKADAHHPGGFTKFGALALDRIIGAPITRDVIEGGKAAPVMTAPRSFDPPAPPVVENVPRPADTIEVGSRWEHKRQEDRVVTVVAFDGPSVELHNGEKIVSFVLTKDYKRVH